MREEVGGALVQEVYVHTEECSWFPKVQMGRGSMRAVVLNLHSALIFYHSPSRCADPIYNIIFVATI